MIRVLRGSTRVAIGLLASASILLFAAPASADEYPTSATPSRIILNASEDPATSQAFAWRTDAATTTGKVEVTRPDGTAVASADSTAGPEITFPFPGETWTAGYTSRHHEATVTGLTPDTVYRYRVGSPAGWSPTYEFRTAAATPVPWRMLYFGDTQTDLKLYSGSLMERSYAAVPDARLALHAGDLINDSEQDYQWGEWFEILDGHSQRMVTTPVMGNHELHGDDNALQYHQHFNNPKNGPDGYKESAYHFDYQGVRFLILNSNKNWAPDQIDYVRSVLENNPNKWTVVSFHHPVFSASWNIDRDNKLVRDSWMPLLEEYNVDLVLQGHDHLYSRGHAAANQISEGVQGGPVYVLSMAGMKQYGPRPAEFDNYAPNGGVEVASVPYLATYQDIEFDGDYLRFNAVVAGNPQFPYPDGVGLGSSIDSFTVIKESGKAGTSKRVLEGLHYAPDVKRPTPRKIKLLAARPIGKTGKIRVKVRVPAAGNLTGTGVLRSGKRKLRVNGKTRARKAGNVTFALKLNKAGKRTLRKLKRGRKVAGKVTVTYRRAGQKVQRAGKRVSFRR